jgi:hypothetical protein
LIKIDSNSFDYLLIQITVREQRSVRHIDERTLQHVPRRSFERRAVGTDSREAGQGLPGMGYAIGLCSVGRTDSLQGDISPT